MGSLTRPVKQVIAAEMPDRFGLIFDGWTHASEHYIAVYVRYEVDSNTVFRCMRPAVKDEAKTVGLFSSDAVAKTPLLCMAHLLNDEEEGLSARGHMEFLATMLPRDYGKQLGMCCFLVADICSVNRRLATLMGVPLVGCASHRLNRAVQLELADYEEELDTVQKLMLKLQQKLNCDRSSAKTRGGSTFFMIMRYFYLLEFIDAIDDELEDMMPSPAQTAVCELC
ncbi:hypothetical protein PPTG_00133 [Phytophthora nicotianae INRA-310]|uniref:Uncharacterized protein n=1 Tax=Phytophthora nicotianae (strain INRA-310) TaxID=761204 RepID=W2RE94_PHYN3|nr:hypothetical protein PPTG_00133 [Phytophthora nicotianae INRA-310]ETN23556.1 hypothetical protein PPTG_00133 [Phytophthora nicotianae INRA-310]